MMKETFFKTIEIGIETIETEERDRAYLWIQQFQMGIYSQGAGWEGQWTENH